MTKAASAFIPPRVVPHTKLAFLSVFLLTLLIMLMLHMENHELTMLLANKQQGDTTEPEVEAAPVALLNRETIQKHLLAEAPWAESHGADHQYYIGAGLLYYSFAYTFQSETIVVLGSGGGFAPRMLRQAQRDMKLAGIQGNFQLILIDAHLASAGWGSTFYADNEDTVMRQQFQDIRYIFEKTDDAIDILKKERISIDYLHVDADHSFEQSYKDFQNYFELLAPRGVVSFHDTSRKGKSKTGVAQSVQTVRDNAEKYGLQMIDAHYLFAGIAFAIREEAPALKLPRDWKRRFCKTNAAVITKSSSGFTTENRNGLSTLGDFVQCERKYNMTALSME